MEPIMFFLAVTSLAICLLITTLFSIFSSNQSKKNLPPGPLPIIGHLLSMIRSRGNLEDGLKLLHAKYGPVVTLYTGLRPSIFVAHSAAHEALVQKGLIFSSRPQIPDILKLIYHTKSTIAFSPVGQTWRLLRGNLSSKILSPPAVRSFSPGREWALEILVRKFEALSDSGKRPVPVMKTFEYTMFSLISFMCFGEKIEDERLMQRILEIHSSLVFNAFSPELNSWPPLVKILYRKRWNEFVRDLKERDEIMLPLVKARRKLTESYKEAAGPPPGTILSYVDTLLDLQLPGENHKIPDLQIVGYCSEILNGGAHTSTAAFQWTMANLVKYPKIQEKLYNEIAKAVDPKQDSLKEEDLNKIPYLKAVVLEVLRRHPLGYALIPHAAAEETSIQGYRIPKDWTLMFVSKDVSFDPQVWEDPIVFRPERFLTGEDFQFDIVGSKEIKMMPFGAGKRICPGFSLGLLHLEFFVGNMVWKFEWKAEHADVDLEATPAPTKMLVLKKPLNAYISPRRRGLELRQ